MGSGGGWGGVGWAGRLLTFSAFRMDAYLRWALIRGWALIRIKLHTCNVHLSRLDSIQMKHIILLCNIRIMINVPYLVSDQVLKKSLFFSFNTCSIFHAM